MATFEEDCYSKSVVDHYVLIKADKVPGATLNNIVLLDGSNGNIKDSNIGIDEIFTGSFADGGIY